VNLVGIINPSSSSMDGQSSLKAGLLRFALSRQEIWIPNRGWSRGMFSSRISKRKSMVGMVCVAFPKGEGKMTGKMAGDVRLAGEIAHSLRPLAGIRGAGHLTVRNGQVPSLRLNANLMKLAHFNDLGPATNDPSSFNLIATDLELADQRISSRVIDIDGYGVDVDGSGSVSGSGSDELNYRGLAEITTKEGFFTNIAAPAVRSLIKRR